MTSNNSINNKEFPCELKIKLKEPETTTSMGKKTTTSNMSGNKQMNKLAAEWVKRQGNMSDNKHINNLAIEIVKKEVRISIRDEENSPKSASTNLLMTGCVPKLVLRY